MNWLKLIDITSMTRKKNVIGYKFCETGGYSKLSIINLIGKCRIIHPEYNIVN